jgi:hypothetical protein
MGTLATLQDENWALSPTDPEYLIIRGAQVQTHPWDEWAVFARDLLTRSGWKQRRRGSALEVYHPVFCQ